MKGQCVRVKIKGILVNKYLKPKRENHRHWDVSLGL